MSQIVAKIKSVVSWFKKDKKRLVLLVVVLVGVFLFLRGRNTNTKIQYQTEKATKGTIVSSVSASGQILSSNLFYVSSGATGTVANVYVKNGDKVYAGQAIAKITLDSDGALANTKAWASLVSSQVSYNAANNSYRSTQATLQNVYDQIKGHDSDETFEQKEMRTKAEVANDNAYDNLKTAKANLAASGLSYRLTSPTIVAANSGIIDNLTIAPGMVLSQSSTSSSNRVAVIRLKGNPIATFNVSEIDVNRVKPGQKATITLDSIPEKTFTGNVLTVDKVGTISSGVTNYPVTISFDTDSSDILPNMAASANIIIETRSDVLIVPSSSIQTQNGETVARVLREGAEVDVPVETGLTSDTQTEIVSGLTGGDEVITGIINPTVTRATSVFSGGFGGVRGGAGAAGVNVRRGN